MLSAETAAGKYPIETVKAMTRIICEIEKMPARHERPHLYSTSGVFINDVVCLNAARMSVELNAKAIIGFTASGYTAFKVSSYRPKSKIFIFSPRQDMLGTLNLVRGVKCFFYDKLTSTDETIEETIHILKETNNLAVGDVVVNTGSMPIEKKLRTNMIKVSVVE